jgi:tight adherence protein B
MRRRVTAIAVSAVLGTSLAVALATPATAAAEGPSVHIRKIDVTKFPDVSITASLPEGVDEAKVSLSENGLPIQEIAIEPLGDTGTAVDVVLVIDTSGSMQGQPIASAVAAALEFTTGLPDAVPVGIVTFADKAKVLVRPTTDHSKALAALGNLKAQGETALYDGVTLASRLFKTGSQHNLVVLSDGADTASRSNLATAAAAARKASAAVFSVGLTSGEFDAAALRSLSQKGGGRYSPVDTAELSGVYGALASELTSQFVISYTSEYTKGGETNLALSASGGRDSALTLLPELQLPAPVASKPAESAPAFGLVLEGSTGLLFAVAVCFVAFFTLLMMLLGSKARKAADRELTRRTSGVAAPTASSDGAGQGRWVPEPFVQAAETVGEIGGLNGKIERKLERAGAPVRSGEFLLGMVGAAIVGGAVGSLLMDAVVFSFLSAALAATVPLIWLGFVVRKRASKLHDQLADVLMILASSLRAGHSFFQAIDLVSKEIAEPGASEFGRVVAEVRLGRPTDEAMNSLAERIGSDDFKWALLAVNIQREVGGNLAEVLDTVADTIRERDGIRRQIDVLTAEGRLSVAILTGLPIAVAFYMTWVNPEYIGLLFNTGLGLLMTTVACSLLGLGVFWMKKVVKIDV